MDRPFAARMATPIARQVIALQVVTQAAAQILTQAVAQTWAQVAGRVAARLAARGAPAVPTASRRRHWHWRCAALSSSIAVASMTLAGCVTQPITAITLSGVVRGDRALEGTVPADAMQLVRNGTAFHAVPDMVLLPGDALRTFGNTTAVVSYPGGARAYIYPDAQVRIGSIIDDIGKVFVKVRGAFKVRTNFVTAGSEGTQYWVNVAPGGEVRVVVVENVVHCESNAAGWPSQRIRAGQQAVFRGTAPALVSAADPAEIRRETDWIQRIDQRVPVKTTISKWVGLAAVLIPIAIIATDRDKAPPSQSDPRSRSRTDPASPPDYRLPAPTRTPANPDTRRPN